MYRPEEVSRVLARSGARHMTEDEFEQVAGGINTGHCTLIRPLCSTDGDCPVPPGCPPPG